MSDATLEILIKTKADLAAAQATIAELKKTGVASGEAAAGAAKLTDGLKEQSKHSEFLGLNHRGLHKVVHSLSEQFPLAGMAARAMLNPILFAFTASIGIFTAAKERLSEFNKELEESGKAAAEPSFQAAIEAKRTAMEEFSRGMETFKDQLAHLFDPEIDYHKAIQTTIDLLHEQYAAMAMLADAQKGLALENVNRAERSPEGSPGHISKEQAEAARFRIEQDSQAREAARKQQESADAISLKQQALGHAAGMVNALEKQVEAAEASAKAAKAKQIADESLLRLSETQAEKLKAAYDKAQAAKEADDKARERDARGDSQGGLRDTLKIFGYDPESGRVQRSVDAAQAHIQYDANAARLRNLPKALGNEASSATLAGESLRRAQEALKAEQQRIHDLQEEIDLLRQKKAIQDDAAPAIARAKHDTAASEAIGKIEASGPRGKMVGEAAEESAHTARQIITDSNAGRSPSTSEAQNEMLQSMAQFLAGHDLTLKQAAQMFTSAEGNGDKLLSLIERIVNRMEQQNTETDRIWRQLEILDRRSAARTFVAP